MWQVLWMRANLRALKLCHPPKPAERVSAFVLSHANATRDEPGCIRMHLRPWWIIQLQMGGLSLKRTTSETRFGRLKLISRPTYGCMRSEVIKHIPAAKSTYTYVYIWPISPRGGYAAGVSRLRSKKKSVCRALLLSRRSRSHFICIRDSRLKYLAEPYF